MQYALTIEFLLVVRLDEMHNCEDVKTLCEAEIQHLLVLSLDLGRFLAIIVDQK
jgi:hypothetical protein